MNKEPAVGEKEFIWNLKKIVGKGKKINVQGIDKCS